MTKDELIQKITEWRNGMRDAEWTSAKHGNYLIANEAAVKALVLNNVLELLEELEDCNNVTK